MKNILILYIPAFISRFALQFTLIALPWALQNAGDSLTGISSAMVFFFAGALVSGFSSAFFVHKIPLKLSVVVLGLTQFLLCAACIIFIHSNVIPIYLFISGFISGIFKPLSRIWTVEYASSRLNSNDLVSKTINSEIFVSFGAAIGGLFGTFIFMFQSSRNINIYIIYVFIIPLLLMIYFILFSKFDYKPIITDKTSLNTKLISKDFLSLSQVLLRSIFIYFLAMIIFSIWFFKVPYIIRLENLIPAEILAFTLSIHPIGMLLGQVIASKIIPRLRFEKSILLIIMSVFAIAQGIIPWLATIADLKIFIPLLVFFGGGLVPGFIFPLLMLILRNEIQNSGYLVRSRISLLTTVSIDCGQLVAIALLGTPFVSLPVFGMPILFLLIILLTFPLKQNLKEGQVNL